MESATQLFARLWQEKYAALYAAEVAAEATRRAEAFVDGPRPVGPWLLRPLTAYDLLILDGYECPIAVGDWARTTPAELAWFAWTLRADLAAGPLRRWLFIRAMRRRHRCAATFRADLAAASEYFERHFADSAAPKRLDPRTGQPTPQRELGTNWLAPLVIGLACETGWPERDILALPLDRLWQYLSTLDRRRGGTSADFSRSKRLRADCLREVNEILTARRAAAAAPSAS